MYTFASCIHFQRNLLTGYHGERIGDSDDPAEFSAKDRHQPFPTEFGHLGPPTRRLLHRKPNCAKLFVNIVIIILFYKITKSLSPWSAPFYTILFLARSSASCSLSYKVNKNSSFCLNVTMATEGSKHCSLPLWSMTQQITLWKHKSGKKVKRNNNCRAIKQWWIQLNPHIPLF